MSVYSIQPLVPGEVRTYPLASRKSKVNVREFAKPDAWNSSLQQFLHSLPQRLSSHLIPHLPLGTDAQRKQPKKMFCIVAAEIIFSLRLVVLLRRVKHLS